MPAPDPLALEYLEAWSRLDPVRAFTLGDQRFAGQLTDYSPEAREGRAQLARRALEEAASDGAEPVGRAAMRERLAVEVALVESGEWLRDLNVFGPQVQVRQSFDLMSTASEVDWDLIAQKLAQVPAALDSFRRTLEQGRALGRTGARRQALACATQTRAWGGGAGRGFFSDLARRYPGPDSRLRSRLEAGAGMAEHSYLALTDYLERDYAPDADPRDGVGRERYQLAVREYLGLDLDLEEAYAYGWEELARLEAELSRTADLIAPGLGVALAVEQLELDPGRAIEGADRFRRWNQEFLDATIAQLNGSHFDIPAPVRRVEVMLAPPGGSPAMYYTPPTLDFTRPGRTWYPTLGRSRFPLWNEVTTAFHEGVPGHHLQLGETCYRNHELHPFQTMLGAVSGHVEGWALYAERLMGELGYLENPDYRLGMLAAQAMRAARVVIDIGLHLGLALPDGQPFHPGERWSWELAVEFLMSRSLRHRDFCAGEVDRYLGVPAQAISYKLGERIWLEVRQAARVAWGAGFNLREFHRRALELGCVGLGQLRAELATFAPGPG